MAAYKESEADKSERRNAQQLAHALVEEAWNLGAKPMTLDVEYEGADWEVHVKVKHTEEWQSGARNRNS